MSRTSIAAAVLAIMLLAAPAAGAKPTDLGYPQYPSPEVSQLNVMPERITDHPADSLPPSGGEALAKLVREQESVSGAANRSPGAKRQDLRSADAIHAATQAELRARGRAGAQTGSLAGTTDATARALAAERAYATYGTPEPIKSAPLAAADDDGTPWALIAAGLGGMALLFGAAVLLVVRPRRVRVPA